MKLKHGFSLVSLFLVACATPLETQTLDIETFAGLVEGTFETPKSDLENNIRDRRIRVHSEALSGVWFYTQMNTGETRKVYRQRVSRLTLSEDGTRVIQTAYGLIEPEIYVDAWNNPELLNALTAADFKPYFEEGCDQVWTAETQGGWRGYVDPQTCRVSSKRRNTQIRIESESYISDTEYRTTERGYDIDMNFLWGSQPGEMITLYPVH